MFSSVYESSLWCMHPSFPIAFRLPVSPCQCYRHCLRSGRQNCFFMELQLKYVGVSASFFQWAAVAYAKSLPTTPGDFYFQMSLGYCTHSGRRGADPSGCICYFICVISLLVCICHYIFYSFLLVVITRFII
jgi:hypothetical protein